MQRRNIKDSGAEINQYTLFIMLYYLLAPMEDILTGKFGTVAKYLAIIIAFFGFVNNNGGITLKPSTASNCIIYLMVLSVASCIWATDRSVAIHRNVAYLLVPGLAWFVGQLEFSAKEKEYIITASIVGGLLTVGYLVLKGQINITGVQRMKLTEGNDQNNFAALLYLPFSLCFIRAFGQSLKKSILYVGFALLFAYMILLTGSRGALLSMLLFLMVYILFSQGRKRVRLLVCALIALVIAYFVILPLLPENLRSRLFDNDSYTRTINSEENRIAFWKLAFTEICPKNPILGVGAGCTPLWLGKFFRRNRGMHNTYINMLCEFGLFGLPAFLWMLYALFIKKKREGNPGEIALFAGICMIIFFLDAYPKKFFWNIIMLIMIDTTQPVSNSNIYLK